MSFADRMARLREEHPGEISRVNEDLDAFDLLALCHDKLIGATVFARSDPESDIPPVGGCVVSYDEEGLRVVRFERRWGATQVIDRTVSFGEVNPAETRPGSLTARHRCARNLAKVIAEGTGSIDDYERRLLELAEELAKPGGRPR